MDSRGSILLMTLILSSFLSVLLLLATESLLLGMKAQQFFESSVELFYLAESGMAHGQAFCRSERGAAFFSAGPKVIRPEDQEGNPDIPFDRWIPWGKGAYLLTFRFPLEKETSGSFPRRDSGILLTVKARFGSKQEKHLALLMEEPPSCNTLAWWEPESPCEGM